MPPKADAPRIMPCSGCGLPVLRWHPHQICTNVMDEGVWCMNCIPHTPYRGVAASPVAVGHP